MTLEDLFDNRLVFVTGKGGVGKSTCGIAMALAAARRGKRVLFCEMAARAASEDLLEAQSVSATPGQPLPNEVPGLWTALVDVPSSLQDYFVEALRYPKLVKLATQNKILARLWNAAPSVSEFVLLNSVYQFEQGTHRAKCGHFDLIVVDLPASGHAVTMLGVPKGMLGIVRVGPIARRASEMDAMLTDRSNTAVCVVTLPEELPVNESLQLVSALQEKVGIQTTHVVINSISPGIFDENERALIARLTDCLPDGPGRALIDVAAYTEGVRARQLARIADLKARLEARFVEVRLFPKRGVALIRCVADALTSSQGVRA